VRANGDVRWVWTQRTDGDLVVPPPGASPVVVRAYQHTLSSVGAQLTAGRPVSWTRQVHGSTVVSVPACVIHCGTQADAQITRSTYAVLAVFSADCAPVVLCSTGNSAPVMAVAHVGWKGLVAGVLGTTVAAMRRQSDDPIEAHLGPCICARCYEFTGPELDGLRNQLGPGILTASGTGTQALDLRAALRLTLARHHIALDIADAACTACDGQRFFSHRARAESSRQAVLAWINTP